jgi:putative flippase GtrA
MSNTAEPGRLAGQIGRFLVIGSLSAATDLGCYYLLTNMGLPAGVAKGISFVLGMMLGWVGNKFWTFASPARNLAEPFAYLLWYATTLGLNVLVNALALWTLSLFLTDDWAKAAAAILATGTSAAANFIGLRFIVFARCRRA